MKYFGYLFEGESWGIELCGEGPTEIRRVRAGGPADYAGLQAGDIVLMANGINVTRFGHQEIDLHCLHQKHLKKRVGNSQLGNMTWKYYFERRLSTWKHRCKIQNITI